MTPMEQLEVLKFIRDVATDNGMTPVMKKRLIAAATALLPMRFDEEVVES